MERISFETAKLALEKGYKNGSNKVYTATGKYLWTPYYEETFHNGDEDREFKYEAPYQAELQEWLREKHNIFMKISHCISGKKGYWDIWLYRYYYDKPSELLNHASSLHDTYEEAVEVGLKDALTYYI